jgi:hypothetical protein
VHGGYPPLGDAPVLQRVFTLLRHLLQQPFDREAGTALPEHLIAQTETIPGAYLPGEAATLRKDLEKLLTPYGFRSRNDNVRHGYAIGTALLSIGILAAFFMEVKPEAAHLLISGAVWLAYAVLLAVNAWKRLPPKRLSLSAIGAFAFALASLSAL